MPKRVLILSAAELPWALPLKEAVTAMEEAFRAPERDLQIPLRTQLTLKETGSTFFVMPALGTSLKALGTKVAGVIPHNRDSGHDPVQAYYLLLSAADGRLLALMDGNYLTSARTAATSALATRLMARDVPSRLAICGTGTQARFHLRAIPEVKTRLRPDRKSTRLNSSHVSISYAVFCLKKKTAIAGRKCSGIIGPSA